MVRVGVSLYWSHLGFVSVGVGVILDCGQSGLVSVRVGSVMIRVSPCWCRSLLGLQSYWVKLSWDWCRSESSWVVVSRGSVSLCWCRFGLRLFHVGVNLVSFRVGYNMGCVGRSWSHPGLGGIRVGVSRGWCWLGLGVFLGCGQLGLMSVRIGFSLCWIPSEF